MLEELKKIENTILLDLLRYPNLWKSLDIDYHPPRVERLYTDAEGYRLSLHYIHPCTREEALLHPHPWASAMAIMEGNYEMGLGFSPDNTPDIITTVEFTGPGYYEITNIDSWHYVRPVDSICKTVMLSGPPWGKWQENKPTKPLMELSNTRKLEILEDFYKLYFKKLHS